MFDEERKKLKVDMGQAETTWCDLNSFRWEEEDVERKKEEIGGMTRYYGIRAGRLLACSSRESGEGKERTTYAVEGRERHKEALCQSLPG